MSFNTYDFIFDNISSNQFNLTIAYFNGEENGENLVSKHNIDKIKSSFGEINITNIEEDETREFEITLVRQTPIELYEIDAIHKWLMPFDTKFRKLYINDENYHGYYYECKITEIRNKCISGYPYAIKCKILCKSQYMYSNEIKKTFESPSTPLTFTVMNDSSKELKPTYIFKCNQENGNINLKNNTTNQIMYLSNLKINEIITIDSNLQELYSNQNYMVMERFNKNFLKFKTGVNNLTLNGNVGLFEIKYKFAKIFVH